MPAVTMRNMPPGGAERIAKAQGKDPRTPRAIEPGPAGGRGGALVAFAEASKAQGGNGR